MAKWRGSREERYYLANPRRNLEKTRRWQRKMRAWLDDFKANIGCMKCGEKHPGCLVFHHRNPEEKEAVVGYAAIRWGKKRLLKEIDKCDILCANCHSKLHWEEEREAEPL